MLSRSHFCSVEKATTMSKTIQERTKEEEPAGAKPRSVCLISTSLNRGQSSSFGPDGFQHLGESAAGIGVCQRSRGETAGGTLFKGPRQRVLKCWKDTTSLKGVAGNCNGALARAPCPTVLKEPRETACGTVSKTTCPEVQGVGGNCNERFQSNFRRAGWTTITCKSQITSTMRKSSRIFVVNEIERRMIRCLT